MTDRTLEHQRLQEDEQRVQNWKRWGPYLSERQWGTVREDYSATGDSWNYLPHDHARSRTYRWGEDGLLGWTDRQCRICFACAFWNERDPILKERLFGLSGPEGNHGEDVKECYYYLDATPTYSYAKALYKYPQCEFPYQELLDGNRARSRTERELELEDLGVFESNRYFDCFIEYAKGSTEDTLIRIRVINRGDLEAPIHIVPTLWFRNTWTWGCDHEGCWPRPVASLHDDGRTVNVNHLTLEPYRFISDSPSDGDAPFWMFTDNETNKTRFPDLHSESEFSKDAFHRYLIDQEKTAINPANRGTKVATHIAKRLAPGEEFTVRLRLCLDADVEKHTIDESFDQTFAQRIEEANDFYRVRGQHVSEPQRQAIQRQSDAGLLWSKQFYHYVVGTWQDGDPNGPSVDPARILIRNNGWRHLFNRDLMSMPDTWEYPWYAAWDSAFHMIPFASLDPEFAKEQLVLFLREWYMHPNGQIPAYEWALDDVNPPVHAWACWEVYRRTTHNGGEPDRLFLSRVFNKLLLNFTWWVNRKDITGRNLFSGGFLGLDNIGVFDRSKPLPTGGHLEQADGTAWMAFYASSMLTIAMELADGNPAYGDMASKFFEHFISIAVAMNSIDGTGLWDEEDGFYYDHLHVDGQSIPLKIRSLVGLIPLITVTVLADRVVDRLPGFKKRMDWYLDNHPEFSRWMSYFEHDCEQSEEGTRRLLAVPSQDRLTRILRYLLDEDEFLSPYGIRSLSKAHEKDPYRFTVHGETHEVSYIPAESDTWMFGGNSNWRGPIWFPLNFLIIQSLRRYHSFFGSSFKVECPTGSGNFMDLEQVATEIRNRLIQLFEADQEGRRPCHGADAMYQEDPAAKELVLFYEYFHGDSGRGCGASHQTGWTALVSTLIDPPVR